MEKSKLQPKSDIKSPDAFGTFDSMRAYGYSFQEAISDIIDNSIAAEANNVWIEMRYEQDDSWVRIEDDGKGMSPSELIDAMTIGKKPKNNLRSVTDHGRFGFGLKTASVSQVKRLSVLSKKENETSSVAVWDLDEVENSQEWVMFYGPLDKISEQRLANLKKGMGTIVLWEKPDRLIQSSGKQSKEVFESLGMDLLHHLGCRYHRFLENNGIKLFYNGNQVSPFNPFILPTCELKELGTSRYGKVIVIPYLLPHESKMTTADMEQANGFKGMFDNQGIYLYRSDRLLIIGDWLNSGLKKTETTKLLRVCIDIDNSLDEEWKIDVRKASALIPDSLLDDVRMILIKSKQECQKRYSFRSAKTKVRKSKETEEELVTIWERKVNRSGETYSLNRSHPAVNGLKTLIGGKLKGEDKSHALNLFDFMLTHIENMFPITDIIYRYSESTFVPSDPYPDDSQRKKNLAILRNNMKLQGYNDKEINDFIETTDLF
jgi:hypothetical protein